MGRAAGALPCVVIGAGIAGSAAAAAIARYGLDVLVLDAADAPARAASALPAGLMAPHLSQDDGVLSRLTRAGIERTWREASQLLRSGRDWGPQGALEHRLKRTVPPHSAAYGPDSPWSRLATPQELDEAGLPPDAVAVTHRRAAWIRPAALVQAWLAQPRVSFQGGTQVTALQHEGGAWTVRDAHDRALVRAHAVVLAAAVGSAALAALRLHPVRGQVSMGRAPAGAPLPPWPVNGNGHFLPAVPVDGGLAWMCGSTYGHGDPDAGERPNEHRANLERLRSFLPATAAALESAFDAGAVRAWTGIRCASPDRRPVVGELAPGLWVSTAMGSRGLSFACLCAELVAGAVSGNEPAVEPGLAAFLDWRRHPAAAPAPSR